MFLNIYPGRCMHIPAHIFICLCMCTHTYVHMVAEYFCPLLRDDGCLLFQRHTTEWQRLMSQRVGQVNFIHTITVRLGGGQSRGGSLHSFPSFALLVIHQWCSALGMAARRSRKPGSHPHLFSKRTPSVQSSDFRSHLQTKLTFGNPI